MHKTATLLVTAFGLTASREALADSPHRSGFTFDLGIGPAHTYVKPKEGDSVSKVGLGGLSLGIGGFLTPNLALLARASGTSYFEKISGDTRQITSGFYGVVAQYWLSDAFFVAGGPGYMRLAPNSLYSKDVEGFVNQSGFGLSLRTGYSFYATTHHALRVSLELTPGAYKHAQALGSSALLEWQYY